jgi:hypothetical protein
MHICFTLFICHIAGGSLYLLWTDTLRNFRFPACVSVWYLTEIKREFLFYVSSFFERKTSKYIFLSIFPDFNDRTLVFIESILKPKAYSKSM